MFERYCTSRVSSLDEGRFLYGVPMLVKRILLVVISFVIGYVATYLITILLGTTVEEFWMGKEQPIPFPYFILVGFFIAVAAGIWLDKFMGTEILPK